MRRKEVCTDQHLECHASHAVHISLEGVIGLSDDSLGSVEAGTARKVVGQCSLSLLELSTVSKVTQLHNDVIGRHVDEDILRLDVTVHHSVLGLVCHST